MHENKRIAFAFWKILFLFILVEKKMVGRAKLPKNLHELQKRKRLQKTSLQSDKKNR